MLCTRQRGWKNRCLGGTCPILGDQGRSHWLVVRSLLCHTSGFWLNLPLVLKERDLVFFFCFFVLVIGEFPFFFEQ